MPVTEGIPAGLILTCVGVGILLAVLGIPLALRKIPPNGFYGVRTPTTLRNPDIWYKANASFGKALSILGVALTTLAALLPITSVGTQTYGLVNVALLLSGVLALTAMILLRIRRWKR